MGGKVESQKAKQEKIKNFRCTSLDFESPAPQASNVVAKERKSVRREPAPSIGAELPPGCPVRVGDWGPFAGSESSKSRDRQRSSLQEGLLVYPSTKS